MAAVVGNTDRGELWRATRHRPNDRIVRVVEPRFADGAFRQAVAGLGQRQPAGMVEITRHDWTADGRYYIEYAIEPDWRTLGERLAELPAWQDRVATLERVCSLFGRWRRSPVHPLGLSLHNVVVVAEEEHWLPWLVPCPPVTLATPCDLFGVDTMAVAALAPEVVRGVQQDSRAVDSYALGTLVAQALGAVDPPPVMDDEDRVEAQARGLLWPPMSAGTRLPATLAGTRAGEDLFRTVERYRHQAPSARPVDAEELRSVLATVSDPVSIARELRPTDPGRALEALGWVRDRDGDARVRAGLLGAEIAAERDDHEAELRYLGEAVASAPLRADLRRRRYEAAWRVFESLPPGGPGRQLGAVLLDDIALLAQTMPEDDTELWRRAAEVRLRGGDPRAAARGLHAVLERDPSDLPSLLLYCSCWLELDDVENARQTRAEARRRIDRMRDTQLISTGEAEQWHELFDRLFS